MTVSPQLEVAPSVSEVQILQRRGLIE
ncbi:hypothetical protein LCGC14_2008330, partial [marine sediment metagenome]